MRLRAWDEQSNKRQKKRPSTEAATCFHHVTSSFWRHGNQRRWKILFGICEHTEIGHNTFRRLRDSWLSEGFSSKKFAPPLYCHNWAMAAKRSNTPQPRMRRWTSLKSSSFNVCLPWDTSLWLCFHGLGHCIVSYCRMPIQWWVAEGCS